MKRFHAAVAVAEHGDARRFERVGVCCRLKRGHALAFDLVGLSDVVLESHGCSSSEYDDGGRTTRVALPPYLTSDSYAAFSAERAFSASAVNADGSCTARSARIFRLTSMPASLSPFMNVL